MKYWQLKGWIINKFCFSSQVPLAFSQDLMEIISDIRGYASLI